MGVSYNRASSSCLVGAAAGGQRFGSVSASVAAVIVDEANKTFGTDSVAEDVEYGFAGEIGATPPMDHRIDESGISLPRCVTESREGVPTSKTRSRRTVATGRSGAPFLSRYNALSREAGRSEMAEEASEAAVLLPT